MRLRASDILRAIAQLPRDRYFSYINPSNRGQIEVVKVEEPEGPIYIRRHNPAKGQTHVQAKQETISGAALRRVASAIRPGLPLNIDRILGASYNIRAVLEALLANTPEFYYCYPGRVEVSESSTTIQEGHKHLIWLPNQPHPPGVMQELEIKMTISEIPVAEAFYGALVVPDQVLVRDGPEAIPGGVLRRHAQIQIALVEIGERFGFRTWISHNVKGIQYAGKYLDEIDGVIPKLESEQSIASYPDVIRAALAMNCIWFKEIGSIPAAITIRHTTQIEDGLASMQYLKTKMPFLPARWVIAAADEDRDGIIEICREQQFRDLDARYFSFASIEELYSLCQRRRITGVSESFLDSFIEQTLEN